RAGGGEEACRVTGGGGCVGTGLLGGLGRWGVGLRRLGDVRLPKVLRLCRLNWRYATVECQLEPNRRTAMRRYASEDYPNALPHTVKQNTS
ncbi:MAG: hypothetical protein AB8G99_15145, partial [Planctomycetaceae bacterium]